MPHLGKQQSPRTSPPGDATSWISPTCQPFPGHLQGYRYAGLSCLLTCVCSLLSPRWRFHTPSHSPQFSGPLPPRASWGSCPRPRCGHLPDLPLQRSSLRAGGPLGCAAGPRLGPLPRWPRPDSARGQLSKQGGQPCTLCPLFQPGSLLFRGGSCEKSTAPHPLPPEGSEVRGPHVAASFQPALGGPGVSPTPMWEAPTGIGGPDPVSAVPGRTCPPPPHCPSPRPSALAAPCSARHHAHCSCLWLGVWVPPAWEPSLRSGLSLSLRIKTWHQLKAHQCAVLTATRLSWAVQLHPLQAGDCRGNPPLTELGVTLSA